MIALLAGCVATPEPASWAPGEGFDEGDRLPDLSLQDQGGDWVSLASFVGDVVVLDVSTMWCPGCLTLGAEAERIDQAHRDQGFVYVTVLQQGPDQEPITLADVDDWVRAFALTAPVLADPLRSVAPGRGFPCVLLVDRDRTVLDRLPVDPDLIDEAVVAAL